MTLNFSAPANNLSFGYVSYQILRQLWLKKIDVNFFPIGNTLDFSSFDKAEPEFIQWAQNASAKALKEYSSKDPVFRLWHIQGSHESIGAGNNLFVFHECDALTPTEVNILNNQKSILVSSKYTKEVFEEYGVKVPVHFIPLGFDDIHFKKTDRKYYGDNVTAWGVFGKAEKRKAHLEVIRAWVKKFGNNKDHILHTSIFNPFLSEDQNKGILNQILEGKNYFNVVNLPYVKTLSEHNDVLNSINIVLDLSLAEGWSLPSYHAVCLGKHAILHNATAIQSWATSQNAVLVESTGKTKAADGMFFAENGPFNIGNFFTWSESDLNRAFDEVLEKRRVNPVNEQGIELGKQLTWTNTVDQILKAIEKSEFKYELV
jgi:hypothetical protein